MLDKTKAVLKSVDDNLHSNGETFSIFVALYTHSMQIILNFQFTHYNTMLDV